MTYLAWDAEDVASQQLVDTLEYLAPATPSGLDQRVGDLNADVHTCLGELAAAGLVEIRASGHTALTGAGRERANELADHASATFPAVLQRLYEIKRDREIPSTASQSPPSALRRVHVALRRTTSRRLFERGLDTIETAVEASHFHPDRVRYRATGWRLLPGILPRSEVSSTDVFLDLGAGKGRVIYQAARRYPFARVIGVEISPRLSEIARANLDRRRRGLRCRDVELVTCDAAEFAVPDDVTIAFLFVPFTGETARRVIDNLVASIDRRPRPLRVIYWYPRSHPGAAEVEEYLRQTGRFEPESQVDNDSGDRITVYAAIA